ncbi:LutC/YkgG family protein [Nocardioides aurantiacus]|uniref:L-lactate dehydrogenase complex protein LldG n=1 Tax=Nocardioides aurantiacus TaxID=86796 RepID=A0A3N2CRJ8_9ACTN|nr:LUD domain-containing protein [Nocardioides aurantiacus]ROR89988.1 L-lactate dehydrogenase complex protein LldG [Nocardioides aurantiacus]
MSARDDILARVREATATAVAPVLERPASQSRPGDVDLFVERVADYRAVVERCTAAELPARLADVVGERRVVVPDGLLELLDLADLTLPGAVVDDGLAATDLDRLDGVVTTATVGIAETGTIVLDHGPGQGRRAVTLVPDLHVCVVRADQVVADVQDAVARLDPTRPHTWISGPSATSDIELDRVEGVHGPRQLHVVVVG